MVARIKKMFFDRFTSVVVEQEEKKKTTGLTMWF